MKKRLLLLLTGAFLAFSTSFGQNSETPAQSPEKSKINKLLNNWHAAAGKANFEDYFGMMAKDAIFIGTDPTENWVKSDFMEWSKPYFDRGKAWDFKTLERNIFLDKSGKIAWFDELLETQMGICRGSGVVKMINGKWKIKHYVLSIAIPNDDVDKVTEIKKDFDSKLISELKARDQQP